MTIQAEFCIGVGDEMKVVGCEQYISNAELQCDRLDERLDYAYGYVTGAIEAAIDFEYGNHPLGAYPHLVTHPEDR